MDHQDKTGERARAPFAVFVLDEARRHVINGPQWKANDRASTSIVKNDDLTVSLLILKPGAHLRQHAARKAASAQVLSGRIRFTAAGAEREVGPGMLAMVEGGVPHAVEALEESAVLLIAALG
ncbi:MAG TPA: cupin domain-containing protein [Candidatus Binataceae bacterium]|jgi:quercetin dioxygenase-like cupin family protein|nr:cupin domain-containing protein [Candidatus Binataceae bacterium]